MNNAKKLAKELQECRNRIGAVFMTQIDIAGDGIGFRVGVDGELLLWTGEEHRRVQDHPEQITRLIKWLQHWYGEVTP